MACGVGGVGSGMAFELADAHTLYGGMVCAAAATAGTSAGGHSSSEQPPVDLAPDYIVGQASLYHQGYSQPV